MSPLDGTWRNERGSEMTLRVTDGVVSGTYRTAVGRPGGDESFPVAGHVEGDLVAFTVRFAGHGSVAAWAGRILAGDGSAGERIVTLYHLVRGRSDDGTELAPWESTLAGASTFRRVP